MEDHVTSVQPLDGRTIAITGTFDLFDRRMLTARLRDLGARVSSTVSAATDLLVVGINAGSKLAQARKHNVAIIEEVGGLEQQLAKIIEELDESQ